MLEIDGVKVLNAIACALAKVDTFNVVCVLPQQKIKR